MAEPRHDDVGARRSACLELGRLRRPAGAAMVTRVSAAVWARAWAWYLVLAVPLTPIYLWSPVSVAKIVVWPIIGWSSVAAIVVGVRRHRPSASGCWYLLAAGVGTMILGDSLYSFRSIIQHAEALFPSYVDVVYLAMYPLLVAGLTLFVHHRSSGHDRAGAIDAMIISISLGLVSWVLLIAPYVRADSISVLERVASMMYPIGDIGLLALIVRLAIDKGRRPMAFWLLAASLVGLLVADTLYGFGNLAGEWQDHNPVDVGWIVFYVGVGAAALHPSMRDLSARARSQRSVSTARLLVVGSAALVPPVMLFIEGLDGAVTDASAIAAVGVVLLILVLVRIAGLASETADFRSEARFRAMVHEASDAVVIVDGSGRVLYFTPSTPRVLGWDAVDLHGSLLGDTLDETDQQRLSLLLMNRTSPATVAWRMRRADGTWRDHEVVVAGMRGTAAADQIVLTMRDVTDRNRLDLELRRQTLSDSLTGLANRTLFLDRVAQAIKVAQHGDESVAVLLFDIDDFKVINDSLGHAAGDELLVAVAGRLTKTLPVGLTIARLGGDEFAVLLEGGAGHDDLGFTALRIQAALQAPLRRGTQMLSMRASIGVSLASSRTHTADDVLREADLAMYVAKQNGKDRYEFYDPTMHDDANRRFSLAGELQTAITVGELVVFYQPIIDVRTSRIVGAEALVRWIHPRRGLISPAEFIPIAESSGLVVPLGRFVLEDACRTTNAWKRAGIADADFYVSVNLSARHLQDDSVLHDVSTTLTDTGLAGSSLVLEVTETGLIEDMNPAGSTLARLKQLGLRIAVDDFGTGYSSLAYLSSFPIDIIKIDKSFIDQVTNSNDGKTMVRAVIELAATLGLTAIAEGVESAAQAAVLETLGCPLAQGYVFAKPMPADEMAFVLGAQADRVDRPARRTMSNQHDPRANQSWWTASSTLS